MSSNSIRFFSYRGCEDAVRLRKNSPAADSKVDYIIEVLNRCGYNVEHVSKAPSSMKKFIPAYIEKKGMNTYRYFASFDSSIFVLKILNRLFLDFQFFLWCLIHLKKEETIIVYHSLGYSSTFIKLKKIKKINIIGEIEEIYQDVHKQSKSKSISEYKFIHSCSKYLFPTSLLDNLLNKKRKPSAIIHGVYSVENIIERKLLDGKIHVVYGGTLDPQKGGAYAAVAAAEFLSKNYHLHICGFGDSTEIVKQIEFIKQRTQASLTFEGELTGDDYKCFIQKCQIGLSTQSPDGIYNDTSFPSKILVYLSNGLKVVTIRIPVIEQSAICNNVCYYDNQLPQEIAAAIENAVSVEMDGRETLKQLDKKFENELISLLNV